MKNLPRKTTRLKALLTGESLEFLLEVHNGLSARIAEEAGFPALWASGLTLSASLGLRDNNEATWTQVLEMLEYMNDATIMPILVDGDSGHGNFNTVRRLVTKLEQRGLAGLCLEDKLFPKTNSFLRDGAQPLAEVDEFCGKLKAARDSCRDRDFVLVARTEALVMGHGVAEALRRAEAYRAAGADAVIVHSKSARPDEVFAFLGEWANRLPVILIPTKYYATPTAAFREHRVAAVIWANHLLRGAIVRMQEIAGRIRREESVIGVEDSIASLGEVFRLQGDDELQAAEKRYLRDDAKRHQAIILAATRGDALAALTADVPKTLLRVGRQTILEHIIAALRKNDVHQLTVVAGYRKEMIALPGVRRVDNVAHATTGELASLACALDTGEGDTLVAFGDVLFRSYIAGLLTRDTADVAIAVDTRFADRGAGDRASDFVRASPAASAHDFLDGDVYLERAEFTTPTPAFAGEWIGLLKLSAQGLAWTREFVAARRDAPDFSGLQLIDLLNHFVASGRRVKVHYIQGHWTDVDSLVDLNLAQRFEP